MDENKTEVQTANVANVPAVAEPVGPVGPVGETGEPGIPYDEDAIVPDGWKPEPEDSGATEDKDLSELFGMKAPEAPENPDATPEAAESVPEPPKEETAPDYKAMYEELLRNTQDTKNRDTFRQVYEEQKAAGMSDAAARLVAKDAAGGKEFSLTDDAGTSNENGKPDYAAALNQLHSVAPDLKEIPAEVTRAMMDRSDPGHDGRRGRRDRLHELSADTGPENDRRTEGENRRTGTQRRQHGTRRGAGRHRQRREADPRRRFPQRYDGRGLVTLSLTNNKRSDNPCQ